MLFILCYISTFNWINIHEAVSNNLSELQHLSVGWKDKQDLFVFPKPNSIVHWLVEFYNKRTNTLYSSRADRSVCWATSPVICVCCASLSPYVCTSRMGAGFVAGCSSPVSSRSFAKTCWRRSTYKPRTSSADIVYPRLAGGDPPTSHAPRQLT